MNYFQATKSTYFTNLLNFKGKATHTEFLYAWLTLFCLNILICFITSKVAIPPLTFITFHVWFCLAVTGVCARCLRNNGRDAWWTLLMFTIFGVPLLFYLCLKRHKYQESHDISHNKSVTNGDVLNDLYNAALMELEVEKEKKKLEAIEKTERRMQEEQEKQEKERREKEMEWQMFSEFCVNDITVKQLSQKYEFDIETIKKDIYYNAKLLSYYPTFSKLTKYFRQHPTTSVFQAYNELEEKYTFFELKIAKSLYEQERDTERYHRLQELANDFRELNDYDMSEFIVRNKDVLSKGWLSQPPSDVEDCEFENIVEYLNEKHGINNEYLLRKYATIANVIDVLHEEAREHLYEAVLYEDN